MTDGPSILLLDEDPAYSSFVPAALGPYYPRVKVRLARSMKELERELAAGQVDLVITEIRLAWVTVEQVIAAAKSHHPNCPVLVLTATTHEAGAVAAVRAGADAYLLKSQGLEERLGAAVRSALESSQTIRKALKAERRLENLLSRISEGVFRATASGRILEANPSFLLLFGFASLEEALATRMDQLYADPAHRASLLAGLREHGVVKGRMVQMRRKDGALFWAKVSKAVSSSKDGEIVLDGVVEEVREKTVEAQKRSAALPSGEAEWDYDLEKGRISFSPGFYRMLGLAVGDLGGTLDGWLERVPSPDAQRVRQEFERCVSGETDSLDLEYRIRAHDGHPLWVELKGSAVRGASGEALRIWGVQRDISDRKGGEEQIQHDSRFDGLTGLPNRFHFMDLLEQTMGRSGQPPFAVLALDMDRFKFVNDSLGHVLGDQLLISLANRLKACLRPNDVLARLSGDEFAVLLHEVKDAEAAIRVAERIHEKLERHFDLGGHELFATISIGIALSEEGYSSPEVMMRDADTAMHRAKSLGRARHEVFHHSMHTRAVSLLRMEGDLRRAVDRGELAIAYQPVVSLDTGRIAGFEALLRWRHPEKGTILPEDFIPLAEETGLIVPIAKWVLTEACRQAGAWQTRFPMNPPVSVSVNLSSQNLSQPDLVEQVGRALAASGMRGGSLGLEITETTLVENAEQAAGVLAKLRALNIRMHIDDFGTGYSSLSYLHRLPIDSLKIDRSFVSGLCAKGEDSEIVKTIMTLALNLGLTVVAEGVETREQAEYLRSLQCPLGQGFFFHAAVEPEAVELLLEEEIRRRWRGRIPLT
jgi:diguanylate cyclase (GGDEF)-like protein/PAS domain S-box-containing protein